ncbi:MAG: hypothetical protein C5B50_14450 [Verrucomicrobia bacterium]|nr:MAG: hypothetical protein C5B50_14450 [Verrucomicrobiota bacterium]
MLSPRRLFFRLLSILAGLILGLLLAEATLRILHIQPERYPPQRWFAWDGKDFRDTSISGGKLMKRASPYADLGVTMGEYVPRARFKVVFPNNPRGYFDSSNGVLSTINSLGLRGGEISPQKPAGAYRILGLGDSFTFGEGVKDDDTFLHQLELRLNAAPTNPPIHQSTNPSSIIHHPSSPSAAQNSNIPAPTRFEVLNAGVQGYNTRDEVVYLEKRWLSFDPDLVLLVFYINDAYDDSVILNRGQELGIYDSKPTGLGKYSYLWDLTQYKYAAYRNSQKLEEYYKQHFFTDARTFLENPGDFKVDWTVCRSALEHAVQLTRERNVKLGLVMFPELSNLKGGYHFLEVLKLVRETCARLGIPFMDLLDTFGGHEPKKLWVHPSNHHPNELAHAMAADAIETFVRHQFLESRAGFPPALSHPNPIQTQPVATGPQQSNNPSITQSTAPLGQRFLPPPELPQSRTEIIRSLIREGRLDEAKVQIEKALQLQPDDEEAHSNLGNVLHTMGRLDEAIAQYQQAIRIKPDFAVAYLNLGNVQIEKGRPDQAIASYRKAIEISPDFAGAQSSLGLVLLKVGQVDEATARFKKAIELSPDSVAAHLHLGDISLHKGDINQAVFNYGRAVELRPDSPQCCNSLAWVLATGPQPALRSGLRALELAEKAEKLSGGTNPLAIRTLAAAYAETGQFPKAMATAERALQLAVSQKNTLLVERLRHDIALYQAHSPCRDVEQNGN